MRFRHLLFTIALTLLVACGGAEPPAEPDNVASSLVTEDASPTNLPPTERPPQPTETAVPPTAEPTNTSAPTATQPPPTPTPLPTEPPTNTPEPEPTAVPPTTTPTFNVPELVWLPYSYGSYGSPILTVDEGTVGYAPEPAPIEVFFDYDNLSGRIAYGGLFFYGAANGTDSVTDLSVYDYTTQAATQWLDGNVGRAVWSPAPSVDGRPQLAVAIHNGETFDLHLMSAPFESEMIRENIQPYFSWSPDGQRLAYITTEGFLMESAAFAGPRVETAYAQNVYQNGGWVGDAPLWATGTDYLIYADNPFTFSHPSLEESFTPVQLDGTPLQQTRPNGMLWSADLQQLIGQVEGFTQSVQIYLFSEDLRTVIDTYFLENSQLVGWYQEGESILVLDINQEPQIWSLTEYSYITPE